MTTFDIRYIVQPPGGNGYMISGWVVGVAILPSGGPEEIRISVGRPPKSRPPSHRSYSGHSGRTGRPNYFYSCG